MENQGQKRSLEDTQDALQGVKVLLLDVEGTTTPIQFVKEKLVGYVKENLKTYLDTHWEKDELQDDIQAVRDQAATDKKEEMEGVVEIPDKEEQQDKIVEAVVNNITAQMEKDRKTTCLKQLQGHIWREAYKTGKILGEVYEDVVDALKEFKTQGKNVYIFSSGSVESQKLLFGYTEKGDLTEYIAGYFDSTTGGKTEKESYTKIAEDVDAKAEEIMFITDIPAEAKPASEAGMKTSIVVREGNTALTEEDKQVYDTISTFSELFGEANDTETPAKK